jgi:hypothetical protein
LPGSYQEEREIAHWIDKIPNKGIQQPLEDNIDGNTIEEVFNFLTEEKGKFLQGWSSTSNHRSDSFQNKDTSLSISSAPDNNVERVNKVKRSDHAPINLDQSKSREQKVAREAESEHNFLDNSKDQEGTSRINIATHNIRGITRITDQDMLIEEIHHRNIGILGLSETKLTVNNQEFAFKDNNYYRSFSSAGQVKPYGSGVLLLVRKDIGRYIESVERIPGFMVAINILSRGRKTFVCQIYLPCQKKDSLQVQKEIQKVIDKKRKEKYSLIIMGDFNAVVNPRRDRSRGDHQFTPSEEPEIPIFDYLLDNNLIDIQEIWEEDSMTPTWRNNQTSSRIDYMWSTRDIAAESTRFQNKFDRDVSDSDHSIMATTFQLKTIIHKDRDSLDQMRSKSVKLKTISLEETSDEQWEEFRQKMESKLKKEQLKQQIVNAQSDQGQNSEDNIRYLWNAFENLLIRTAFNHLHCKVHKKRIQPKDIVHKRRQETGFHEFNNYYRACKIRRNWNKIATNQELPMNKVMWKELTWLQERTGCIDNIPESHLHHQTTITREEIVRKKNQIHKATQLLRKLSYKEEKKKQNEAIKKALQKRCEDLKTNQKRVIQTLTNSYRDRIKIDRIKVKQQKGEDYITTQREEIFHQIYKYYSEAFKKRDAGFEHLEDSWKEQYSPREFIKDEWFSPLYNKIEEEELKATLRVLPNNKAAGPSGIKYEMLKHLGNEGITVLTELFNLFLIKGATPRSWKESLLYPISKGKEWKCELNNTRPIVLLEVTRKCFTKILTDRLDGICRERNVLRGPNFADYQERAQWNQFIFLTTYAKKLEKRARSYGFCFRTQPKHMIQ